MLSPPAPLPPLTDTYLGWSHLMLFELNYLENKGGKEEEFLFL